MKPYTPYDVEIAARTAWGEARGEGVEGMAMVVDVLFNRANDPKNRWPKTINVAATQKWQFSAWNPNDPNLDKLIKVDGSDKAFRDALIVAAVTLSKRFEGVPSVTGGANHYLTTELLNSGRAPVWAKRAVSAGAVVKVHGNHTFIKL